MSIKYTEQESIDKIANDYSKENLNKLYSQPYIKDWNGITKDSHIEYQEVFAEFILDRINNEQIPFISKSKIENYCTKGRQNNANTDNEEKVQRDFYYGTNNRILDTQKYGKPFWFELQTGEDGDGKGIDLVYFNNQTNEINIFELKYRNKEPLLRAVLEIQTYYQRVDWEKAFEALKNQVPPTDSSYTITCDKFSKINKYILLDRNSSNMFNKYTAITNSKDHSYVKDLISLFDIKILIY